MLEELTDKHLTLFGWFPMLRFLQRTCTYMQYECIEVNGEPYLTFTFEVYIRREKTHH